MFRCGELVYEIALCRRELVVREVTPPDGTKVWSVNVDIDEVKGMLVGPVLARAWRVAPLGPTQFAILFGQRPSRAGGRLPSEACYRLFCQLRRIGRRVLQPNDPCGACEHVEGACDGCGRRFVAEALRDAPFAILTAAAKHVDPVEQMRAANEAYVRQMVKRSMGRKAKPMRTATPRPAPAGPVGT